MRVHKYRADELPTPLAVCKRQSLFLYVDPTIVLLVRENTIVYDTEVCVWRG